MRLLHERHMAFLDMKRREQEHTQNMERLKMEAEAAAQKANTPRAKVDLLAEMMEKGYDKDIILAILGGK